MIASITSTPPHALPDPEQARADAAAVAAPDPDVAGPSIHDSVALRHDPVVESALQGLHERADALFGSPPQLQSFYADKNGGGGHAQARSQGRAHAAPSQSSQLKSKVEGQPVPGGGKVAGEVGDPKGYETKNHALAWARTIGSDKAMVVKDAGGRWHAVVADKVAKGGTSTSGTVREAVPAGKGIEKGEFDTLRAAARAADARVSDPKHTDADVAARDLAWKTLASKTLGVDIADINIVTSGKPVEGKVNINLSKGFDAEGRTANYDQPGWVQLGPAAFDQPANALSTWAHEEVHLAHHDETARLYQQYQGDPKNTGPGGFRDWLVRRPGIDPNKAEVIAGYQGGSTAATELAAHLEAVKVSFAAGDYDQARTDLTTLGNLKNLPTERLQMQAQSELVKFRNGLKDARARQVFDDIQKTHNTPDPRSPNNAGILHKLESGAKTWGSVQKH
ncbi:MAG: hypothetical protein IT509_03845 [Rhodocyclaceae bacterium]|nr:hypothetical protein [Rhodocyclaceae bacterium]